jgi:hypothetical protein
MWILQGRRLLNGGGCVFQDATRVVLDDLRLLPSLHLSFLSATTSFFLFFRSCGYMEVHSDCVQTWFEFEEAAISVM